VRHAEKKSTGDDPGLTDVGNERAKALAKTLQDAGISAIVTTTAERTKKTAQPLDDLLPLTAIPVERNKVEQTVRAKLPGAVLVVGHSNSILQLVQAFRGLEVDDSTIDERIYDNLFIIIRANGMTRFIHSRYGAPSP
jgi:broad specificity phosphatase PhoE